MNAQKVGISLIIMSLITIVGAIVLHRLRRITHLHSYIPRVNMKQNPFDASITVLRSEPQILLISNFLSKSECDHLIQLASSRFARSTVQMNEFKVNPDRTSYSSNLTKDESPIVCAVQERALQVANNGATLQNVEPFQVVRYEPGQFYKPHYDYFVPGAVGTKQALKRGGQRTLTFFVYLNDLPATETGGATVFPKLKLRVRPQCGNALVFANINHVTGKEDDRLLHGGEPPQSSIKYGLNIWFREREFT